MRNLDSSTSTGVGVEEVEKGAIKVLKADKIIDSENSVNSLTDILLKFKTIRADVAQNESKFTRYFK